MITAEQARAELARRRAAREELARRRSREENAPISGEKSSSSLYVEGARQLGRIGRGAATGIAGLADIPNLAAIGLHAVGLKKDPLFWESKAKQTQDFIDDLTKGSLKPQSKAEEYMDTAAETLGPMALAPFTGGASLTGAAARAAGKPLSKIAKFGAETYKPNLRNIAGQTGATSAMKAYRESRDEGVEPSFLEQAGIGLLGSAGARAALGIPKAIRHPIKAPKDVAAEVVGRATGFKPLRYAEQEALGIPSSIGSSSESGIAKRIDQYLGKHPVSSKRMRDFAKHQEKGLARNLGIRDEDLQSAVEHLPKHLAKEGAEGYKQKIGNIFSHYEKKFQPRVDKAIDARELVDVEDIEKALKERARGLTSSGALADFDTTPSGQFLKKMESYRSTPFKDKELAHLPAPLREKLQGADKKITYADFDLLRDKALKLKDELKRTSPGSNEKRDASNISRMLGEKRYDWMEAHGTPQEAHAAKWARKIWREYANKEHGVKKYVHTLIGENTEEAAFKKLLTDERYTKVAMHGLDKSKRRDLTEAIVADLGKKQNHFNVNTAFTEFHKLSDPVQDEVLKGLAPTERKAFRNTMNFIGKHKAEIEEIANTSGTAHTLHAQDFMKKGMMAMAATVPIHGSFSPLLAAKFLVGNIAGTFTSAKLWTDPVFVRRINNVITAKNARGQAGALKMLSHTPILREEAKRFSQSEKSGSGED